MDLTVGIAGRVDGIEGVLLQIHRVQQLALLIDDIVLGGGTLLTDDLHHLVDLVAALEDGAGLLHPVHIHHAPVFGPGVDGVDGRILAGVGPLAGQAVERAHHLQGGLGHRLLEVAAGGRHGAADGDGGDLAALQADLAGPLIEGGNDGLQIGGEGLLAGNLLQTAAHLTHGLGPAAGGVCQQQHIQAFVQLLGGGKQVAGAVKAGKGIGVGTGLGELCKGIAVLILKHLVFQKMRHTGGQVHFPAVHPEIPVDGAKAGGIDDMSARIARHGPHQHRQARGQHLPLIGGGLGQGTVRVLFRHGRSPPLGSEDS